MAARKMETGNPIAIAVLLVILVGAIVATVIRIGAPAHVAAAPPETTAVAAQPASTEPFVAFCPTYNPFRRPAELSAEAPESGSEPGMPKLAGPGYMGKVIPLMPLHDVSIEPLGTGKRISQSSPVAQSPAVPAPPKFALLTTVRSGDRVSAVIRVGESASRTVSVGEVLDGGFVVEALTTEYAILTNGRLTLRIEKLRDVSREAVP